MKNFSKILAAFVCAALVFVLAACGNGNNETSTSPAAEATDTALTGDETNNQNNEEPEQSSETGNDDSQHTVENKTSFDTSKHVFVTFTVKDMGEFQVELYPEYAPNTVTNFVNLADSGYYNGTKFHRVVDNFMVQGGENSDVDVTPIYGEFESNGFEKNTLKHERGVISMARTNDPDSATGQFFICNADSDFLDGNYAAFGKVTYGMEVIDKFSTVERGLNSLGELAVPQTDIVIEKAVVSQ